MGVTDSRPKLLAGSPEGYFGHVDGKPRECRMNHPKGLTVDDRGNVYVADTMNMAIRKISDAGIVAKIYNIKEIVHGRCTNIKIVFMFSFKVTDHCVQEL